MWREQRRQAGNGRGPGGAPFPAACDGGRGCEPDPGDVQGHVVAARRALQRCVRKGRPDTRRRREGAASACAASVRQWTGGARGACKAATAAASPVRRTGLRRATRRTLCDSVPCVRVADRRVGAEAAQVPVFSGLVGIEGQRGQGPAGSVTPTSLPCVSAPPPLLVPRSCVLCRESSTKLTVLCACGQFLPRVDAGLLMCRASQLEEKQDEVRQSCTPARRQLPMCALPSAHARAGTDSVGRVLPRDAA